MWWPSWPACGQAEPASARRRPGRQAQPVEVPVQRAGVGFPGRRAGHRGGRLPAQPHGPQDLPGRIEGGQGVRGGGQDRPAGGDGRPRLPLQEALPEPAAGRVEGHQPAGARARQHRAAGADHRVADRVGDGVRPEPVPLRGDGVQAEGGHVEGVPRAGRRGSGDRRSARRARQRRLPLQGASRLEGQQAPVGRPQVERAVAADGDAPRELRAPLEAPALPAEGVQGEQQAAPQGQVERPVPPAGGGGPGGGELGGQRRPPPRPAGGVEGRQEAALQPQVHGAVPAQQGRGHREGLQAGAPALPPRGGEGVEAPLVGGRVDHPVVAHRRGQAQAPAGDEAPLERLGPRAVRRQQEEENGEEGEPGGNAAGHGDSIAPPAVRHSGGTQLEFRPAITPAGTPKKWERPAGRSRFITSARRGPAPRRTGCAPAAAPPGGPGRSG